MPDRKLAEFLREVTAGEPTRADDMNALIRFARGILGLVDGYQEEGTQTSREKRKTMRRDLHVRASYDDIPPFSIFGISTQQDLTDPQECVAEKIGISSFGSGLLLLTNDSLEIPQNAFGTAFPIDYFDVVKVQVTGSTPLVGHACGPDLDEYGITADAYGFVCLSAPDDDNYVNVMRTREPVGIVGLVSSEISARQGNTLGVGYVNVYYRDPSAILQRAGNPSTRTKPWEVQVWNALPQSFAVGEVVRVTERLGVGLVVDGGTGGGDLIMFRLEEELENGASANARILDACGLVTEAGPIISVTDDTQKWFGRGVPAPNGDDGGDPPGESNIGYAKKTLCVTSGTSYVYSVISMGTWWRYLFGNLLQDGVWTVLAEACTGHDGEWPRADDGTTEGVITLDPGCRVDSDAVQGAAIAAIFNEKTRTYVVWDYCCPFAS